MLLPKPQKRTSPQDWTQVKKDLIPRFARAGIVLCELGLENCTRDNFLGFAHRLKRRHIKTLEELEMCILACNQCHQELEYDGTMYEIVTFIIKNRTIQP